VPRELSRSETPSRTSSVRGSSTSSKCSPQPYCEDHGMSANAAAALQFSNSNNIIVIIVIICHIYSKYSRSLYSVSIRS